MSIPSILSKKKCFKQTHWTGKTYACNSSGVISYASNSIIYMYANIYMIYYQIRNCINVNWLRNSIIRGHCEQRYCRLKVLTKQGRSCLYARTPLRAYRVVQKKKKKEKWSNMIQPNCWQYNLCHVHGFAYLLQICK